VANAESVLAVARACHDDNVARELYPELRLSGYSIEDIVMHDALLDAVEDAVLDVVVAPAELMPVFVVGRRCATGTGSTNTAVVFIAAGCSAWSRVVPAHLPEFYERRQLAPGDDVHGAIRIGDVDVPFGRGLLFTARTCPDSCCKSRSAWTCSSRCRPVHRPPWPVDGADPAASIAIGRAEDCCAPGGVSRCLAGYVYAAAGEGESTTVLAWDGRTMIWENGVGLPSPSALPKGERRSIAGAGLGPAALRVAAYGHLR